MTERRARGSSPAGRGNRRTSRSARSRPAADSPAAAPKRTTRRRSESADKAKSQKIGLRTGGHEDRHDRTILGLSTGKAVILAIVVGALALTLAVPLRTYFTQRAEAAHLAQERIELEADVAKLRDRRAQQQDPAYVRSEARDRLRLVMPGETPYIVQVPGIEAPAPPAAPTQSKAPEPWYTELWRSISQPQQAPAAAVAPAGPPAAPQPAPEGPR
ncbi:septum formation initiator family protein [Nocardia sp. NPDC052112]|uniref:FtsB family cell division protein n=1 Tax=Nocardia sp. NPDC052112 TaxID=3155646 RepID=UPI0034416A33